RLPVWCAIPTTARGLRILQLDHVAGQVGGFAGLIGEEIGDLPAGDELLDEGAGPGSPVLAAAEGKFINGRELEHVRTVVEVNSLMVGIMIGSSGAPLLHLHGEVIVGHEARYAAQAH